jgi:hypothetical protein
MFRRLDRNVAERIGQRDEVTFGIDHDLLDQTGAPLEEPTQQVRFARSGIPLHQQPGGQELLKVHERGLAVSIRADVDVGCHRSY